MQFQCDACQKIIEYEPTTSGGATPSGWRNHIIGPSRVFLCGACGNPAHFSGGLSPYLRQILLARGIDIGNK